MNKRLLVLSSMIILAMAGSVSAVSPMDPDAMIPDPSNMTLDIGEIGTFIIEVETGYVENHTISFNTSDPLLVANLTGPGSSNEVNTGALSDTGSGNWTPPSWGTYNFTMKVMPLAGIEIGKDYGINITDNNATMGLLCETTASVTPIPELTTIALVGIGLIGLVALGRRKD